ncbi:HNH endonuclease [Paeniglutamicibacter sulfureus]|uniref:MarR family transcriptional regulator n=1 Tax=Paeniglutamicibacter sulfureus TaxID=43666 RepID=UPI0026670C5C|nr:MarR family transcriptional regulator [Paeniglutamicibacter sulfureus]MDO2933452.1 HNH endonuclease [Paeniglutamicibacter sulfureus]
MSAGAEGLPAGAVSPERVRLTSNQRLVLSALAALLPGGSGRLAQAEIVTHTGRSPGTVSTALKVLEGHGLIERKGSKVPGIPTLLKVTKKGAADTLQKGVDSAALIDCFRASDFIGPGNLWQAAPKCVALTFKEVKKLSTSSVPNTVRNHLALLADLPVKVVTVAPNPNHKTGKLYTFHNLSGEQQVAIAAHLDGRLKRWRTKPKAEREAEHEELKQRGRERFGPAAYGHLAKAINALSIEDDRDRWRWKPGTPCWIYGGEVDASGYGVVDGVLSPGVRAHRITYYAARGSITSGKELHHRCEERACVRPDHLWELWPDEHDRLTAMSVFGKQLKRNFADFISDPTGREIADAKAHESFARRTTLATPIGPPRPNAA